jgi:hypothetical protein
MDGTGPEYLALASVGIAAQAGAALLGVIGTGTILFVVRTTAARQSLILS